jgi:hypothetical protein
VRGSRIQQLGGEARILYANVIGCDCIGTGSELYLKESNWSLEVEMKLICKSKFVVSGVQFGRD